MKLLLLSLLAVHCSAVVRNSQELTGRDRLEVVLDYIKNVEGSLKNNDYLINTPPQNTEDCCCLTALECYRSNLRQHFNSTYVKPSHAKHVRKLIRGLQSQITEETLHFCNSNNTTTTCQDSCEMHPKKSVKEFLERLQSLINRALSQLTPAT